MNAAIENLAAALLVVGSLVSTATAQTIADGHRGVCSDCHVGAARNRYEIMTADSVLVFSLDTFGFSKTIGTFDEIVGGFVFDPASPEAASVNVSVRPASLEMNDGALNSLVLSDRFLDAAKHDLMTYESSSVEPIDATHMRVDGELSLRGVALPLSLDVTINKLAPHPLTGRQTAGLLITGRIKRSEFGIRLGLPNIGDEIEFTVYAQAGLLD